MFAVLLGVQGWRGASLPYKAAVLIAPVLGVVFTLSQINAHYAYVRTVSALAGNGGVRDRTGPRQFAKLQARAIVPAPLPARGSVVSVHIPGVVSGFVAVSNSVTS